MPSGEDPEIS